MNGQSASRELSQRIAQGRYVVDVQAVADAMRRAAVQRAGSKMLVSIEWDRAVVGAKEPRPIT